LQHPATISGTNRPDDFVRPNSLAGGSFGQLAVRVRVLRLDGRPVPLLLALARQLLVCLVIPPLVFRPDGRGLHDLAAGTAAFNLVIAKR
jgi:uncharacterized RDD family membrane protein YckC